MFFAQNNLHTSKKYLRPITPTGEALLKWKNAYLLIPEKQIIPVCEGTHLQVVIPVATQGQLATMYHQPKEILTTYLLAIAAAKQLVLDPKASNQHVNVDMRTIRPSFDGEPYGRYTNLVIEIYGRRVRGKHFGEPAPTVHNHWEGERYISKGERAYLKDKFVKKVMDELRKYERMELFTNSQTIQGYENPGEFTFWNGSQYQLIAQPIPLLDAKTHGFHFVLRNIPEDLKTVWKDPSRTLEMVAIGLGVGRFLKNYGFEVSDAFYDINMNWGILWDYFRTHKEGNEKLKDLRKELRQRFIEKMKLAKIKDAPIQKEKRKPVDIVSVYLEALLSLRPNSVHLHTQFAKTLWEIPSKPDSFGDHCSLEDKEKYQIRQILSGSVVGTGIDPLARWVAKNCSGGLL